MAKKTLTEANANVSSYSVATLPADLRKRFSTAKGIVLNLADKTKVVRDSTEKHAEAIMDLFDDVRLAFKAQGRKSFGLIDFARLMDPTTPKAADEYRHHPTYYTLNNMRQLLSRRDKQQQADATGQASPRSGGFRDTAVVLCARLILAVQNITGANKDQILAWAEDEGHMSKPLATRVRNRLANAKPLYQITVPKPAVITVIRDDRPMNEQAAPTPQAPEAQPNVAVRELQGKLAASLHKGQQGRTRAKAS